METVANAQPLRPLPVVAGDLALDFVNTVDDPYGPARFDHLRDGVGLVDWSVLVGLVDGSRTEWWHAALAADPGRADALVDRAHDLRRTLEAVFGASADGSELPADAWRTFRTSLAEAVAHADAELGDDSVTLRWSDDPEDVLHQVAYAAHALLTSDRLGRVKRCAGCPWLYLDQSKNGSRRWCAMDDCGKHEKIRRYVERRAARRTAGRADG